MEPNQQPLEPSQDNSLASRLGRWWHTLNGPMRVIAVFAIVFGLLLLGFGLYNALNKDEVTPPTTTEVSQATAEVSITKDSLNPATITVDAGTQVTWTNNDNEPHQIAANPHPLHDSIDGFDSDNVLQPGDSMSFTFETAGTFTVHDHLDYTEDAYHGTIIVE